MTLFAPPCGQRKRTVFGLGASAEILPPAATNARKRKERTREGKVMTRELLAAQSEHWVEGGGLACGQIAGTQADDGEQCRGDGERDWIENADAEHQARNETRGDERTERADHKSDQHEPQPAPQHELEDIAWLCAQREPDSDLLTPVRDRVSHDGINACQSKE